jgi:glycolate oxidase
VSALVSDARLACSRVLDDDAHLDAVSTDEAASGPVQRPALHAQPADLEELAGLLEVARRHRAPITARGGGTGKAGACVPVEGGVVVSFERMADVVDIDPESLRAKVAPGVTLARLQEAADDAGLRYPPDPASAPWCTVAGTVATNAGGPCAIRYGVTGDYVLGMDCLFASGERAFVGRETAKGVAGYDLARLLVGSEGTLALFTELVLRLVPKPGAVATALLGFNDARDAQDAVTRALTGRTWPSALEYIDGASIRASRAAGDTAFPDVNAAILLEAEGDDDGHALVRVARAAELMNAREVFVAKHARERRALWDARAALSVAVRRVKGRKISEDITVPRREVPAILAELDALGAKHGLLTCAYGHAGDGNVHAQVLFDEDADLPRVHALLDDLTRATLSRGGTCTGEHGVGRMKTRFLEMEHAPAVLALERSLKRAFDPDGLLNPGVILS